MKKYIALCLLAFNIAASALAAEIKPQAVTLSGKNLK